MQALAKIHAPKTSDNPVAAALQMTLADTYGLYLATHNYHWNVEGPNFQPLHAMFGEQYNVLINAIDTIAERIRALGDYAMPFEDEAILRLFKTTSNPLNKEPDAKGRAVRMVHNLIALHEAVLESCKSTADIADDSDDDATENLMVERITYHQKALWMLTSIAKD